MKNTAKNTMVKDYGHDEIEVKDIKEKMFDILLELSPAEMIRVEQLRDEIKETDRINHFRNFSREEKDKKEDLNG